MRIGTHRFGLWKICSTFASYQIKSNRKRERAGERRRKNPIWILQLSHFNESSVSPKFEKRLQVRIQSANWLLLLLLLLLLLFTIHRSYHWNMRRKSSANGPGYGTNRFDSDAFSIDCNGTRISGSNAPRPNFDRFVFYLNLIEAFEPLQGSQEF